MSSYTNPISYLVHHHTNPRANNTIYQHSAYYRVSDRIVHSSKLAIPELSWELVWELVWEPVWELAWELVWEPVWGPV